MSNQHRELPLNGFEIRNRGSVPLTAASCLRPQSTRCSLPVLYKADVQRTESPGDRGQQRETRGQSGTLDYWITSSARCSSVCGIVRPSAFAVLRLMTNSYLVGNSMGKSPGLAPLRIRST